MDKSAQNGLALPNCAIGNKTERKELQKIYLVHLSEMWSCVETTSSLHQNSEALKSQSFPKIQNLESFESQSFGNLMSRDSEDLKSLNSETFKNQNFENFKYLNSDPHQNPDGADFEHKFEQWLKVKF